MYERTTKALPKNQAERLHETFVQGITFDLQLTFLFFSRMAVLLWLCLHQSQNFIVKFNQPHWHLPY